MSRGSPRGFVCQASQHLVWRREAEAQIVMDSPTEVTGSGQGKSGGGQEGGRQEMREKVRKQPLGMKWRCFTGSRGVSELPWHVSIWQKGRAWVR